MLFSHGPGVDLQSQNPGMLLFTGSSKGKCGSLPCSLDSGYCLVPNTRIKKLIKERACPQQVQNFTFTVLPDLCSRDTEEEPQVSK